VLAEQITQAIQHFLAFDLPRLVPDGLDRLETEEELHFERGSLQIKGTADRIVRKRSGMSVVTDYKTSKDVSKYLGKTDVRRGKRLQIPLYALALRAREGHDHIEAEVLSVPTRPERVKDAKDLIRTTTALEVQELATDALNVLSEMLIEGRFPFRRDEANCRFCPYVLACRKGHTPSEERVKSAEVFAPYFALHEQKSS
jgi:RecB family exonuclease